MVVLMADLSASIMLGCVFLNQELASASSIILGLANLLVIVLALWAGAKSCWTKIGSRKKHKVL